MFSSVLFFILILLIISYITNHIITITIINCLIYQHNELSTTTTSLLTKKHSYKSVAVYCKARDKSKYKKRSRRTGVSR